MLAYILYIAQFEGDCKVVVVRVTNSEIRVLKAWVARRAKPATRHTHAYDPNTHLTELP